MTGDERHDILGAKENNLSSLGALYRFEIGKELVETRADQIVLTVALLKDVIAQNCGE